jgi:hypothetical protein
MGFRPARKVGGAKREKKVQVSVGRAMAKGGKNRREQKAGRPRRVAKKPAKGKRGDNRRTPDLGLLDTELLGDHSGREPPGPIPNPEVKPPSADDSAALCRAKVGNRQAPHPSPRPKALGFFLPAGRRPVKPGGIAIPWKSSNKTQIIGVCLLLTIARIWYNGFLTY